MEYFPRGRGGTLEVLGVRLLYLIPTSFGTVQVLPRDPVFIAASLVFGLAC